VFSGHVREPLGLRVGPRQEIVDLALRWPLTISAIPMIGDYISFHPTVSMLAPTLVASVALCALGSLYPAWRATSLSPSDALRRA
jgi:ABC-type lipoprotein release transport system permease subunit